MPFETDFGATRHFVDGDGVRLNVVQAGDSGPTVVFVHGYPDTSAVWLPTIARLVDDFHCVAYDVRGAGQSQTPPARSDYHVSHLVNDLIAVIDDVSPAEPVHLVGHDWGSIQAWQAVLAADTDPRLQGRIASYTTISGPSLGHLGAWSRRAQKGGLSQRRAVARQAAHSWYAFAFQLPLLPELGLRRALRSERGARRLLGSRETAPTVTDDAVNGLNLYRANLRQAARTRTSLRSDLPIQLIVPLRDRFLTPAVYDDLPRYCPNLTRHDVDAGHWVQQSQPDLIAGLIRDFALEHGSPG